VLSVDTAVEGVHFTRALASWEQIGARAFTAAISDLAAMGAQPRAALLSLIVPRGLALEAFDGLIEGVARSARGYGCPVVGGNLSSGGEVSVTTTVIGSCARAPLVRGGARAGDDIYVTGPLGSAALGLALLQRTAAERGPAFVNAWREPRARIDAGLALAGRAHAAIDVSDGALQDLGHLTAASGVGAEIDAERVPLAPGFADLARALGLDPLALALFGGEDYELLYTLPQNSGDPAGGTRIGRVVAAPSVTRVLDPDGAPIALRGGGYRHFED
jgi:thiamine-monophosphate kinase